MSYELGTSLLCYLVLQLYPNSPLRKSGFTTKSYTISSLGTLFGRFLNSPVVILLKEPVLSFLRLVGDLFRIGSVPQPPLFLRHIPQLV